MTTLVLVTALFVLTPLASMSATDPGLGHVVAVPISLPQDAGAIETGSLGAKTGDPHLEPALAKLYAAHQSGDGNVLETLSGPRHIDLETKSTRVILEMDRSPEARPAGAPTVEVTRLESGQELHIVHAPPIAIRPDLAGAIAATGASYETAYADSVQVLAPFASLQGLAEIPGVRYVRLPFPAQPQAMPDKPSPNGLAPLAGSQTSQAVPLTNADDWHAAGYDGTGINVAIYDFGFTGYAGLQASGDLPSTLYVYDWSGSYDFTPDTPGYDHGASCAEIAYDMAPDSTVHLFAFDTSTDLANAVSHYVTNVSGTKVASMSIGYVNAGPYDGTGAINDIVDGAQAAGILWAQSAGNYRKQHWSGTAIQYGTDNFVDWSGTGAVDGNINYYGPEPGQAWSFPTGTEISAFLEWNDWNAARTGNQNHIDYDMGLYWLDGNTWTLVDDSVRDQCTLSLTPVEAIRYTAANAGFYALAVWRAEGGGFCPNPLGHWLNVYSFTGIYQSETGADFTFAYHNECNSAVIPADGDSAVAVGATFWNEDTTFPDYGLESFTSLGPRSAAGGAPPGATVNKPDVVAPDGVDTSTTGPNDGTNYANGGGGFWGTSAAAPHAAGLAALVWEKTPSYTLTQVRQDIQAQALYKGDGGACGGSLLTGSQPESSTQNNRFGWGRVNLSTPTAIDLARFEATALAGAILLEWETAAELDSIGFNLFRAETADGARIQLNGTLIPAQHPGSTVGATYSFLDASLEASTTYYYWLEDVDAYGLTTLHGPVTATAPLRWLLRPIRPRPTLRPVLEDLQ